MKIYLCNSFNIWRLIDNINIYRRTEVNFTLETKRLKTKKAATTAKTSTKPLDEAKFENYFDYKVSTKYVKPHQVTNIRIRK